MEPTKLSVTAHGLNIDDRIGQALEYGARFESETFLGPLVTFYNGFGKEDSNFPAEDLDAVIYVLTELRAKMNA